MTPLIPQRADKDCGCAALAMFAGIAYEDAYVAIWQVDPATNGKKGLWNRELVAAAKRLQIHLIQTRKYDLDEDEGILRVRFRGTRGKQIPGGHFVCVRDGQIYCPADKLVAPWHEYFERWGARGCSLLREVA